MPRTAIAALELVVMAVAGAWTLVHVVLAATGGVADDYWGPALLVLFVVALALALVRFWRERPALRARSVGEAFPEPPVARFFFGSTGAAAVWFVIRMNVGALWLVGGWEKITSPAWGTSATALSGFVNGALAKSAGPSPAVEGWYAWFLQHVVLGAPGLFSVLVSWGELLVGAGILLGLLTGIAAAFGVLMNFNYLLAGTVGVNPILGMLGLFLLLAWRVCGWYGLDRWLLPALGMPWKPGALFERAAATPPPDRRAGCWSCPAGQPLARRPQPLRSSISVSGSGAAPSWLSASRQRASASLIAARSPIARWAAAWSLKAVSRYGSTSSASAASSSALAPPSRARKSSPARTAAATNRASSLSRGAAAQSAYGRSDR
jgi:thiosulfate dehydrogenase [quinone] large subunit